MVFGKLSKKLKEKAMRNQIRALNDAIMESVEEIRQVREMVKDKVSPETLKLYDDAEKDLLETHEYISSMLAKKRIKIEEFVEMYHRLGSVITKYCGKIAKCDPEVGKIMLEITGKDIVTGEAFERLEKYLGEMKGT